MAENEKMKALLEESKAIIDKVGPILNLEPWIIKELKTSKRGNIIVPFTVPMDDGEEKEFTVYCNKYNETRGVYKGGIRAKKEENIAVLMATLELLGFDMMCKTSGADVPFGGAKSWLNIDPKDPYIQRNFERIIKRMTLAFGDEIGPEEYVPAPDMGTSSREMAWIFDAWQQIHSSHCEPRGWGVVTGKPLSLHGCPGRETATARGGQFVLRQLIRDAQKFGCPFSDIKGLRIVIQGFGNAGYYFASLIVKDGAKIIAVSDSKGGIFDAAGLDVEAVKLYKSHTGSVINFPGAKNITNEELLALDCDIMAPSATENVTTTDNAADAKEKIRVELANNPTTPGGSKILEEKGVIILPDILANAGGGTVSYFEWGQNLPGQQWTPEEIDTRLEYTMNKYTYNVLKAANNYGVSNRLGAYIVAIRRLAEAMRLRGQYQLFGEKSEGKIC